MTIPQAPPRRLSELGREAGLRLHGDDLAVTGLCADSRRVRPGDLFVAVPGTSQDGARFVDDAVRAGAAAICASSPLDGVPTLVAADPRAALADIAAVFYGHPARDITIVGITGSLGKTSTAHLTQACLAGGGVRVGVIGSLGVRARGRVHDTGMTTPDALVLQQELRWLADEGVGFAVMEVSSHGILLDRVRGVELALGIFTNLVPDEHLEFHPTPEHYVATKLRFLDMLRPGAPLVFDADDERVRVAVRERAGIRAAGVTVHAHPDAEIEVAEVGHDAAGSGFTLVFRRALETAGGATLPAGAHPLRVPLLGRQQVGNAALAATAALLAGVPMDDVRRGLAATPSIHRRMEIVHPVAPLVIDDTVGNARSIEMVRQTIALLPHHSVRVAYVLRGSRGPTINEHNAHAIADLVLETGARLVVSTAEDTADGRNRVTDAERDAALAALRARQVPMRYEPMLRDAIEAVLGDAGDGDLVLLLGAQGMDAGAALVRELLGGVGGRTSEVGGLGAARTARTD